MGKLLPYLSVRGRANRLRYWLTNLALYGGFLVVLFVAALVYSVAPLVGAPLGAAGIAVAFWASLAVAARRLHDRNKSAWWLVAMYVPIFVFSGLSGATKEFDEGVSGLFSLLSLPFSIWLFVELGCLRGTSGPNRFGSDPLQPSVAEVFT